MIKRNGTCVLGLLLLAGCTSVAERRQADGGFGYLKTHDAAALKVPADLKAPPQSSEYRIPTVQGQHPTGAKLDIRAPQLVLPVAANSRVDEEAQGPAVVLDAQSGQTDLVADVRASLASWAEARDIPVVSASETELETDWFVPAEGESLLAKSEDVEAKRRFRIYLEPESHRRSAVLKVSSLGNESLDDDVSAGTGERAAANLLNDWLTYYADSQTLESQQLALQKFQPIASRLGKDRNGVPAFLLDADFERAWARMPLVLQNMGFEVGDYDKSLGTLFVEYTGAVAGSFWDSLFGSDGDLSLPLDEDDYQVQLGEMGERTSVIFVDEDGKPIPADIYAEISEAFTNMMRDSELKEPK